MRRVDRERREDREDVVEKMILEPGPLRLGQRVHVDQDDVLCGEFLAQLAPARLLVAGEARDRLADAGELLGRREPVRTLLGIPSRSWPLSPATRTMKNSSRLLAEIDRKRSRSSSGWLGFSASSRTRRLNWSHDSSRLMKRSALRAMKSAAGAAWGGVPRESALATPAGLDSRGNTTASARSVMVVSGPLAESWRAKMTTR